MYSSFPSPPTADPATPFRYETCKNTFVSLAVWHGTWNSHEMDSSESTIEKTGGNYERR